MNVSFENATINQMLFLPGVMRHARVTGFESMGGQRFTIQVTLEDGRIVSYKRKQWYAVETDDAPPKHAARKPVIQEVDERYINTDVPDLPTVRPADKKPEEFKPILVARRAPSPHKVTSSKPEQVSLDMSEAKVRPELPGPPVPKPIRGIWSDELGG